jgi:hypothetical protein
MIEWIHRVVFKEMQELMRTARANYGVDPLAFLMIYLASVPFFYYSIFRMVRALARKLKNEIMLWSTIFLASTVAPFLYVLFFGKNLPWWMYGFIAMLIGQGVYSLVRMTKRQTSVDQPPRLLDGITAKSPGEEAIGVTLNAEADLFPNALLEGSRTITEIVPAGNPVVIAGSVSAKPAQT